MYKTNFYKFSIQSSEAGKASKYNEIRKYKLFSNYENNSNLSNSINSLFYRASKFSASMQLPKTRINFYQFNAYDIALQLDDFMLTAEINSSCGFFISSRAKKVFDEYKLPNHVYYPVKISFKNKIYDYYYLLISKENNKVDYQKSIFWKRFNNNERIYASKLEDLLTEKEKENGRLYWVKNTYKEKMIVFSEEVDLYATLTVSTNFFYISERLEQRIIKERFTGTKTTIASNIDFFYRTQIIE